MRLCVLILSLYIAGCASMAQKRPETPPSDGSVIGIMYLGDKYPRHVHVGTTALGNFERVKASRVDYSVRMVEAIKNLMREENYQYVEIDGSVLPEDVQIEQFSFYTGKPKEIFKDLLISEGEKNNLDYMIVIHPIKAVAFVNSALEIHGFGLYTHCWMGNCRAEALNYQDVDIFQYPSLETIDIWNWKAASRRRVEGIPLGDDLKNLDESAINKAADVFLDHFEDLTREKLVWTKFIHGEVE